MKQPKKTDKINLVPLFGGLALLGLIGAAIGTTYTNIGALSKVYQSGFVCYSVCISLTLSFLLPMFLSQIPFLIRLAFVFLLFTSTNLAINFFAAKEIISAAERLEKDVAYRNWKLAYLTNTNKTLKAEDANIENAKKDFEFGTEKARERAVDYENKAQHAFQKMNERADSLQIKGSVRHEAFVETWATMASAVPLPFINKLGNKFFSVSSNLSLAFINDLMIPVFCIILRSAFGEGVIIPLFGFSGISDDKRKKRKKSLLKFLHKIFKTENDTEKKTENENDILKMKMKTENENFGEKTENIGRNFQNSENKTENKIFKTENDFENIRHLGNEKRKHKLELLKIIISDIVEKTKSTRPCDIHKILEKDYKESRTEQRIGQIMKDMRLRN